MRHVQAHPRKTQSRSPRRRGRLAPRDPHFRQVKPGADLADIKSLYAQFIDGEWVGDDHTFWELRENGALIAFCSATYRPETGCAVLSSAIVVTAARGRRLQRRMIRLRERWAKRRGAHTVMTYVGLRNYRSLTTLVRMGYSFKPCDLRGKWQRLFHFLQKPCKA